MKPPFRADQVGSLLRPSELRTARAARERGEIGADQLREIEDRCIAALVRKQHEAGLRGITDGELRRAYWHYDFLEELDGVEGYVSDRGIAFQGGTSKPKGLRTTAKLDFPASHPMLAHFRYLKQQTDALPGAVAKMTIPSPTILHYRWSRAGVDPDVYPMLDDYFADLAAAYRKALRAFADAGCTYLQLDDVNFTYFCDPEHLAIMQDRGDDPAWLLDTYLNLIRESLRDRPDGMAITVHMCRGNFRSLWLAQGGYEPVAQGIFERLNIDGYFMEWDSDRAGGFEPLRHMPRHSERRVVLGLLTSKSGALEAVEDVKRRVEEASKYLDLDRLCLSPQCGFSSTEEGNVLSEDEQWAKLARVVETAARIWH